MTRTAPPPADPTKEQAAASVALHTGMTSPTPTRSSDTIPRRAARSSRPSWATYAREP